MNRMENRHFYFKYTERNRGFTELLKSSSFDKDKIPLPIYFGKWKSEDYNDKSQNFDWRNNPKRKSQVDLFFGIREKHENDHYFWIFLPDKIYVVKLIKPTEIYDLIINIPKFLQHKDGTPKIYYGSCINIVDKKNLSESFSHINSNQKYNRQTIVEFYGIEKSIAEHLISDSYKMTIPFKDRLFYLSPIQFETLIFLIFVQNNIYCSTFRGGTKEKYDLLIENIKEVFPEFEHGIVNIQIKMKKEFEPPITETNTVYIYLGKTNVEKNLFGIDWILSKIKKSIYIETWLKRSLNFYNVENLLGELAK